MGELGFDACHREMTWHAPRRPARRPTLNYRKIAGCWLPDPLRLFKAPSRVPQDDLGTIAILNSAGCEITSDYEIAQRALSPGINDPTYCA